MRYGLVAWQEMDLSSRSILAVFSGSIRRRINIIARLAVCLSLKPSNKSTSGGVIPSSSLSFPYHIHICPLQPPFLSDISFCVVSSDSPLVESTPCVVSLSRLVRRVKLPVIDARAGML